ncbi:MAG: DUF4870 domain-containing protein [bacterium]|nr:DUF4870 domain-containing protein [bacterium]
MSRKDAVVPRSRSEESTVSEQTQTEAGTPREARMWASACHLIPLAGLLFNGIGFVLGPLIIWLIKREDHPFIDEQGKEALNFQITMFIAAMISIPLMFVLIGFVLLLVVLVVDVVLAIIAAIKANEGESYRYPFAIRLIQ